VTTPKRGRPRQNATPQALRVYAREYHDAIQARAAELGETTTAYLVRLAREDMDRAAREAAP